MYVFVSTHRTTVKRENFAVCILYSKNVKLKVLGSDGEYLLNGYRVSVWGG